MTMRDNMEPEVWESAELALEEKRAELARVRQRAARYLYLAHKHDAESKRARAAAQSLSFDEEIAEALLSASARLRERSVALRRRADREIEDLTRGARQIAILAEAAYGR